MASAAMLHGTTNVVIDRTEDGCSGPQVWRDEISWRFLFTVTHILLVLFFCR